MSFRTSLESLIRRDLTASLRERAADLRTSVTALRHSTAPSPAPGSEKAKAAWRAACHEHSARTAALGDCPDLMRSKHEVWSTKSLVRAMETGEISVAEYARLHPLASARELRFAEIAHELNIGGLFGLAYADEYPVSAPEPDAEASVEERAADADLLQLGRQFEAARLREIAACEVCNEAHREALKHVPERPACLIYRASDARLNVHQHWMLPKDLEGLEVRSSDVDRLQRIMPMRHQILRPVREGEIASIDHPGLRRDEALHSEAQARAEEIISAWDAWWAAKIRAHGEYLTDALDEAANDASYVAAALGEQIAAIPARTAEGFRVKLRALSHFSKSALLSETPDEPDPDQLLSHSVWRDVQDDAAPTNEPKVTPTSAVEPSPVLASLVDGTRSAADDALADTRVSPDLRKAVEAHRDATLAMLLETDESNEASDARCGVVEQTGAVLRAVPARSFADVRCKLAFLLPEILPDVNGSDSTAFLENIREDVDRLAQQPVPAQIDANLVSKVDFASGSMEDLQALWGSANSVADAAYAMAWTGQCHTRVGLEQHNAAGKLMQWLGEALADVADEARKEAQRRRPTTPNERETRLTILAGPTIENGDPDEIATLAGEMMAHAVAELARR